MRYLGLYVLVMGVVTFFVYGADKRKAVRGQWRIPESVLLAFALAGGSIGALLAMRFFHHKTRKPKFSVGVPIILVLQIVLCALIFYLIYTG